MLYWGHEIVSRSFSILDVIHQAPQLLKAESLCTETSAGAMDCPDNHSARALTSRDAATGTRLWPPGHALPKDNTICSCSTTLQTKCVL